jgi:hypothetical protein
MFIDEFGSVEKHPQKGNGAFQFICPFLIAGVFFLSLGVCPALSQGTSFKEACAINPV